MMADFVMPRHSAVMERLRRRIELFRRHHDSCESRYDNTAMERLEIERQQTLALHQRCQQTKAKHKNKHRQPPAASADTTAHRGTTGGGSAELTDGGNGTPGEQSRNSTLIALQETVKRKLENAGSPLGRDQINGFSDGFPPSKKACVEDALGGLNGVKNGVVPPLSPMETKHNVSTDSIVPNGNHGAAGAEHNSAGITDNGASHNSESDFRLKEMKQEPVDDILPCILPAGGANGGNSLFPDLNLNDQDWSEIMEEFRSVHYEDIQELFSDDFGDRKDLELPSSAAAQSLIPPDLASVKTEFTPATATSAFDQDSCTGSPQVRPTSSGPPLHTNSPVTAPATSPALPVPQQPSMQPIRSQSHLLPGPPKDLSPAQQLQHLAALEQHRAQILQSHHQQQHVVQKQQQQQQQQQAAKFHQQPNHTSSWPQNAPAQSQLGGTFGLEKPTSPSLFSQDFPNPKTLLMSGQQPNKGSPKAGAPAGYMQSGGHGNMLSHPAAPTGPLNHPANPVGQAAMLDYNNTKPLSHYETGAPGAPRGPPTTQNKPNQAILNLMRHQTTMQKQRPAGMNFRPPHLQHPSESGSYPSAPHVPSNTMTTQPSGSSIPGNHGNAAYIKQQQQIQLMQRKQYLQRRLMLEQEKQRQQQEQQLQRHLTRPPPQYQDQQNQQAQQNPFQQQQQVSQFTSNTPCLTQQHPSGFPEHSISGASQPIGNVNALNGPAPGAQRMFSQTQGMMGMGVGQSGGPTPGAPPAASQADMNLSSCAGGLDVIYGNMPMHASHPNQQRQPVSTMSAAYRQNILAAQQQAHLKSQPNAAMLKQQQQQQQQQLARLPNSMPNAMANNMSSSMPTSIQGALPTQAQSWQQQQPQQHPSLQQGMTAQPSSANGGMPAGFPTSSFHMQSRMTKLPNNAPFSQSGMGNSAAGRALAGMNPGQMMSNMNQQRTNNPAMGQQMPPPNQQAPQQGQPQPAPQTQQVLPDLGPFGQAQPAPNRTAALQCNQAYQLNRTANQQLQFGYNAQSGNGLSGFPAETDLVDSLLKNQSTQEWMDDLDELLASHQ
ncbi:mastermind-like protein 1 isoform X2 [Misgurnus anguillicaudatus]|uniref:mastermind-like protein 1 isoform X2 n=1 Tax=Misgurnus anguillicaudatus TaxID=75329 RepID=UPI003CCFB2CE